jgi:hypothetical protein
MWKKIGNSKDVQYLLVGSSVLKFTGDGLPKRPIPIGDENKYTKYSIQQIIGFNEIHLIQTVNEYASSIGAVNIGALRKTIEELVQEKIWWYEEQRG